MRKAAVKTRFAPSPSGSLHVGNARTAFVCWAHARRHRGEFLLRIEDTDAERSDDRALEALCAELEWLGLQWDEGYRRGGEAGPYRQSERGALYTERLARLEAAGKAYPCFCSSSELAAVRRRQQAAGEPPRYPGTCRGLTPDARDQRLAAGQPAALRLAVEPGREILFDDLVRGPQRFASDTLGDFVIRRSDGTPAFLFSNAVDDALMGITHALRGEDHVSNTPRQLLVLEVLGLPAPRYGHLPLVIGRDGSPLSKRRGGAGIADLRAQGYLPGAVLNQIARLGHSYATSDYLDRDRLARNFDLGRVGKAPAHYDPAQLEHWQREAIARTGDAELWQWMVAGCPELGMLVSDTRREAFVALIRDNVNQPEDAATWARRLLGAAPVWTEAARGALTAAGDRFFAQSLAAAAVSVAYEEFVRAVAERTGRRGKPLYKPLRAALTGDLSGPELVRVYSFLGADGVRERLEAARAQAAGADP